MKYLISAATGALGSKVVENLVSSGQAQHLAVGVRNLEKAEAFRAKGVQIRQADYEDPSSLEKAFAGVERLLLISSMGDNEMRIRHHLNAVAAAKKAGVGHIFYTSAPKADKSKLSLAEVHLKTENAIRDTGIPYTFLRNNWYIENEASAIQSVMAGAPLITAAADGKVSWAPRADYALAAARALTGEGHAGKVYELSGPRATYEDLGAALANASGKDVQVQHVDDATHAKLLAQFGLPEFLVQMVVSIHSAIRNGDLDVTSKDLEALLGRPVTPLQSAVEGILKGSRTAA